MPDGNDPDTERRAFLKWASAVGLASAAPATMANVADAHAERSERATEPRDRTKPDSVPAARRGDPTEAVHHPHPTEIGGVQQMIERYDRSGDPTTLLNEVLRDHIRRESPDSVDVKVRTVGEESVVESKGTYQRTINGWRPTADEVAALERFGEVEFVPTFISTRVELADVAVDDLKTLAELEFVIGVTWNPTPEPESVDKEDLYSNDYYWFESVEGNYSVGSDIQVGIIDSGYAAESSYGGNHAIRWPNGIDGGLADEFDPNWSVDDGSYHGDSVADSAAYMLDDGHSNMYVPLKIFGDTSTGRTSTEGIEFAEEHDIDVINMSFGGPSSSTQCPSTYCDELYSYISAGYIPTASSGNNNADGTVTFPGGEWLSIGTGGIEGGECSDGSYPTAGGSNYGTIAYDNCPYCSTAAPVDEQFVPRVYGCYRTSTDDGTIAGTSFAAPQAAAAAVIMQSNGLFNYDEAEEIYRNMSFNDICPSDEAQEGQLLDAWDAYYQTN